LKDEIKAGIIILTSIVILSVFVILIGGSQFLEKYDTYTVRVMNAAGLETGAQVKLGGVRVGRVLNIVPHKGCDIPGRICRRYLSPAVC
jgi:phospholipid/cholesterol/gamma-HCH transport system substrate-binding protein